MSNLTAALLVLVAVLGGFYGGLRYETGKAATGAAPAATAAVTSTAAGGGGRSGAASPGTAANGATGAAQGSGGFAGGRGGNLGTVTNLTANGFTLHPANGSDVAVVLGAGATVRKTVDGQVTDLQNNLHVTVAGQRDASGNLVATAVTIVPAAAGG